MFRLGNTKVCPFHPKKPSLEIPLLKQFFSAKGKCKSISSKGYINKIGVQPEVGHLLFL
jgi:hypothetical protein